MKNELKTFWNDEFGGIRTVEIEGISYLVGVDVARALGYSNTRDAIAKHVDAEDKATVAIHDGSKKRNVVGINESGVYSLIFGSKLPDAKKFKHWVTSEVLPEIRKTGTYSMNEPPKPIQKLSDYLEVKTFKHETFGVVRGLSIGGEPYFVANDVARALGYKKPANPVLTYVSQEDKIILEKGTYNPVCGHIRMVINESGLCSLLMVRKSKNVPEFRRWMEEEVIPKLVGNQLAIVDNQDDGRTVVIHLREHESVHIYIDSENNVVTC